MPHSVLHATGLTIRFGAQTALDDLSLELAEKAFGALVGENGAGKSTLIRALAGLARPTAGNVSVCGSDPGRARHVLREDVVHLAEGQLPPRTWKVGEFLDFHRAFYPRYSGAHETALLADYQIDRRTRLGSLSTGQVRRVQIVAALAPRPKVLLVDEITAVLDIVGREVFFGHLDQLRRERGATILLGTNLLDHLDGRAQTVFVLHKGRLLSQLKAEQGPFGARVTRLLTEVEEPRGDVLPFSKTGSQR